MRVTSYIAKRYVKGHHRFGFVRIISRIATIAIALGVAAIIIVSSIFNGFREFAQETLVGFDPHIRIQLQQDNSDLFRVMDSLKDNGILFKYAVAQESMAILSVKDQVVPITLKLIDSNYRDVSGLKNSVIRTLRSQSTLGVITNGPEVSVGVGLIDKLGVGLGARLSLITTPQMKAAALQSLWPQSTPVVVVDMFKSNNPEYDNVYCYANKSQIPPKLHNGPQFVEIRVADFDAIEHIARSISQAAPGYTIDTWYELHQELYDAMRFEKLATFGVLSLLIVIAAFSIFTTMSMTVIEKKSEIAMLQAIGIGSREIHRIFAVTGFRIGVKGALIGLTLGLGLCLAHLEFGLVPFDTLKYRISQMPMSIHTADVVAVLLTTMLLTWVATILPSKRAAQSPIARSLSGERG